MVEIRILGPFEVWGFGAQLAVGGTKQRAVLAMLALHANRVVSTDYLVDGLWGTRAPEQAFNAVQGYVSRLRKVINQQHDGSGHVAALHRRSPGYLLQLDGDGLDLDRFHRLAEAGKGSLSCAPEQAARRLRAALDLWRGPALAEFAGQPFATTEIARLEEQHLAVLGARVRADLALGKHIELVSELEALVAHYPLHEQLHEQLILSLYRSGRQADALDAYRRARDLLSEEVGVDPGAALQELEAAVLAHDRRLDWTPPAAAVTGAVTGSAPGAGVERVQDAGAASAGQAGAGPAGAGQDSAGPAGPAGAGPPRVWNVPARNPHFTGRAAILDELELRLQPGSDTLLVQAMYGLGGVGKSQLAIEYAHRRARNYRLVWWIDAEQAVLIPEQFQRLARQLDLSTPGGPIDAVDRVKTHLAQRQDWLLIFDNAERVEDVAPYRPAGSGHIIVTSRSPAWGAVGGRLQIDVLYRAETVALLQARVTQCPPDVADHLARELGDLPLAVAQAVAYMEQTGMDPRDYLREFTQRRAALIARGDVVDYQGRIDTTWQLSLAKLRRQNPAALRLLELSAFLAPEPIPFELFTAKSSPDGLLGADVPVDLDSVNDAVGAAVGFSLLRRVPDGFQLHRLVQAAIRQGLPRPEHESTAATVAGLLARTHPGDPNDPAHWSEYARLAPHVLAIGPHGDHDPAARRLMLDTVAYLNVNADARAGRRIATDLLARWRRELSPDHADTLLLAAYLTLALFWLGETSDARQLGQDTLPRAQRVLGPDHPDTVRLAVYLVLALAWTGDAAPARALAKDSLARIRRTLPLAHPDALRLSGYLALALAWVGDPDALALADGTLQRARSALGPHHPTTLLAAVDLALGLLWKGDAEQIQTLGHDTLARARETLGRDHLITLGSAAVLAQALVWAGEIDESVAIGREYLARTRERLGEDHLITLTAFAALTSAMAVSSVEGTAEIDVPSSYRRAASLLGDDHPITLIAATSVVLSGNTDRRSAALASDTLARAERVLGHSHPLTVSLLRAS